MEELPKWYEIPIGGAILEAGNITKLKTGLWRTFKPIVDQEKCTRCRICWVYCPDNAVLEVEKTYITGKGKKYTLTYEINYDYCKGCGICFTECPVKAIEMVREYE